MKSAVDRGKKAIRILGFGLLVLALLARSNPVQCSGVFTGATEMTQLMNHVELVTQYLKQVEAYATQLQQYQTELKQLENMVTNLKNIPDQVWTAIFKDLQGVISIVKQGQALAFSASNISEEFQNKFKGFVQAANFQTDYKNWSNTVRDSIRTSLAAANLQSQQFASEESALSKLRSMSESAEGRMQALQVGTQIAVEQVAQLQKLRALLMAQMQAQNAYMAGQQQQKDNVKAAEENFYKYSDPRSGKSYSEF